MADVCLYFLKKCLYKSNDNVKAQTLSTGSRLIWLVVSIGSIGVYGMILRAMGGLTPFLDSMSTVLSVIAVILMTKRFVEQWALWIVVDVVTVVMWANIVFFQEGGLFSMGILVMWCAWLVNAIYGLVNWIKLNKAV